MLALAAPRPLFAQGAGCFVGVMARIDSLHTRADSIALGEQIASHPPQGREVCASLVGGYLLALASSPLESDWPQRTRARDLLNAGLRGNEGEPRLYFAMGVLDLLTQAPVDGKRMLGRAKDHAAQAQPPLTAHERAMMHFIEGSLDQDDWRDARSEGSVTSAAEGNKTCSAITETPGLSEGFAAFFYVCSTTWDEVMHAFYRHWQEDMRPVYNDMVDEFTDAMRAEPAWREPEIQLLGEYVYEQDYARAYDLLRSLSRTVPDSGVLLASAGAIYHYTGRDSLAQIMFARAFAHMPADDRHVYDDIRPLLKRDDSTSYSVADSVTEGAAREAYWRSLDPLYLTSFNERRLEHYARVATVDMLFGVPKLGLRGWNTDGGQIWIRYGRPRDIYEFRSSDIASSTGLTPNLPGRDAYWVYDSHGLRFAFHRNLGSRRYRFDEFGQAHAQELKESVPQRGAAFFADSSTILERQIVRILGADNQPQVLVYAPWPHVFEDGTKVGLTLLDAEFRTVAQWLGTRPLRDGISAELDGLKPGTFPMALELWNPAYRQLARMRDTVTVSSFTEGLAMSDILLATHIQPPAPGRPVTRKEFQITPAYGLTIYRGWPLALYWETYGLTPDSGGVRRYSVELAVSRQGGSGLPVRILRGLQGLVGSKPATAVRYDGTSTADRAIEWLALEGIRNAGDYDAKITITDRVSHATTVTHRAFVVK